MKVIFQIILIAFTAHSAYAQFSPAIFLSNHQNKTITQIECADFTNDGKTDLLASKHDFPFHHLSLYIQSNDLVFEESNTIPDTLSNIESFAIGDINNDNWNDFVLAYEWPSFIVWYENFAGQFTQHVVDTGLDLTQKVLLADLDDNGALDIVSLQHLEIVIYMAFEGGNFDTARVIHSGTEFYDIDVADYNGDGFEDVSVGSSGFEILINDGSGNFTLLPKTGLSLVFGLRSGDLDEDTDVDIVSFEALEGLKFYENDGNASFTFHSYVLPSTDNFHSYGITDLNCDSLNDIYTTIPQQHHVVWIENMGNKEFSEAHIIHTQDEELIATSLACDVNLDGKQDLLWGNLSFGMHLNECQVLSSENQMNDSAINVFPNPSNGSFNIENLTAGELGYKLYDMLGRSIIHGKAFPHQTTNLFIKDDGVYLLAFRNDIGEVKTKTILIRS